MLCLTQINLSISGTLLPHHLTLMLLKDPPRQVNLLGFQSWHYLDVFPLSFVVEHMGHVLGENLLAPRARVDADHGDADGPGRVPDGHLQVGIVGLHREGHHWAPQQQHHREHWCTASCSQTPIPASLIWCHRTVSTNRTARRPACNSEGRKDCGLFLREKKNWVRLFGYLDPN